jgi:glyoxylase-like metal-dependent hydrolase (beta-lactamase superfamily II)
MVHFVRGPELLDEGDDVDGWDVLRLPGHADGHIALLREGVLIAGDALLASITPNVGLWAGSRPDPLADYLASLARITALDARVAYGGHGDEIADPKGRALELIGHHEARLDQAGAALDGAGRTAYEISHTLWPEELAPALRRFALAETRAHLEYLARRDGAVRVEDDGLVRYLASG